MILVTGTKRSGTSMWMQILTEAGFPYIGKSFLGSWEDSIKEANPRGFFESPLRKGVYFATNPNPKDGRYIHPAAVQKHVLKVFIPGLVRTDFAFIQRVVATIRPWREYCHSIRRLYSIEDEYLKTREKKEGEPLPPLEMARLRRPPMHPALEWWRENYDLIRDFATRRYAFNLVSYQKLLDDPQGVIEPVLNWCGAPEIQKGIDAVEPKLNTQKNIKNVEDAPLTDEYETIFDEFHDFFYRQDPLSGAFISKLNDLDEVLSPMIKEARDKGRAQMRKVLTESGFLAHEAEKVVEKAQEEGELREE